MGELPQHRVAPSQGEEHRSKVFSPSPAMGCRDIPHLQCLPSSRVPSASRTFVVAVWHKLLRCFPLLLQDWQHLTPLGCLL